MTQQILTIGSGGGRDYSTIAAWESASDNALPTVEVDQVGEMYDDADFTPSALTVFAGGTRSVDYNRTLRAAEGNWYDPDTGNGCLVVSSATNGFAIREEYCTFQGFGVDVDGAWISGTHYFVSFDTNSCEGCQLVALSFLPPGNGSSSATRFVYAQGSTGTGAQYIRSCVFIGNGGGAGVAYGVYADTHTGGLKVQNCTFHDIDGPTNGYGVFLDASTTDAVVENCIATDSGVADFSDGASNTWRNNVSSDTSATSLGTSSFGSVTSAATFTDHTNRDFTLLSSSDAVDGGRDLSGEFTQSIQEFVRHGSGTSTTWDIGAYAYVASTVSLSSSTITLRSSSAGICPDNQQVTVSNLAGVQSDWTTGGVLARRVFPQQVRTFQLTWEAASESERYLLYKTWLDALGSVRRVNYTPVGESDSAAAQVRITDLSITQNSLNDYRMAATLTEVV